MGVWARPRVPNASAKTHSKALEVVVALQWRPAEQRYLTGSFFFFFFCSGLTSHGSIARMVKLSRRIGQNMIRQLPIGQQGDPL